TVSGQSALPKLAAAALAGFLLGTAVTIKQHGALLAAAGGVYLVVALVRDRRRYGATIWLALPAFAIASALPLGALAGYFAAQGIFDKFKLWTFDISRQYAADGLNPANLQNLVDTLRALFAESPLLWASALAGLASLAWRPESRRQAVFLLAVVVGSAATVFAGGRFFGHYFVLLLPAVALLAAVGAQAIAVGIAATRSQLVVISTALVVSGVALFGWIERAYLFREQPLAASRRLYGVNPFPEAVELADYVAAHCSAADSVLVLGSEPEIYFYLGGRAATAHIYMYPVMSGMPFAKQLQRELVAEAEAARPAYILYVKAPMSWGFEINADRMLLEWFARYRDENYTLVGIFDIWSAEDTTKLWGTRAQHYRPYSEKTNWIGVYRRNDFEPLLPDAEASSRLPNNE
ncbi:MAG: hypothetical protein AB7U73_22315, partial [Pirellulales bacterium]